MNGLRLIPRLFHSSEIQRKETNKDHKEEFVDVLCFLNVTSAVSHKVVFIPDYLQSFFDIFGFSHVFLEVFIRTSNSRNMLFI